MTREDIERIVREWQRRLNISHWRVRIDWDSPPPDNTWADVERYGDHYEGAIIRFEPGISNWTAEFANEIVVHELMHLLVDDLVEAAESAEEVMTGAAYKLFDRRLMHEMEGVVDKIALLLVKYAGHFDPAREETLYEFNAA